MEGSTELKTVYEAEGASQVALVVKSLSANVVDAGWIPGMGRSPGEGNGNPFQYSCLENPMDQGTWWATVHRVAKSRTRLSDFTSLHTEGQQSNHKLVFNLQPIK